MLLARGGHLKGFSRLESQNPKGVRGPNNRNSPEKLHPKQVAIAGYYVVGATIDRRGKDVLVVAVAKLGNVEHHHRGDFCPMGDELDDPVDLSGTGSPLQGPRQLCQDFRRGQKRVLAPWEPDKKPLRPFMENSAEQNIGVG